MHRSIPVTKKEHIFPEYRNTPIERLLEYHNLKREHDKYDSAKILIGTCMDNRERFLLPQNFAFVIRAGGADLRFSEFKVSYAIGVGGIKHIAVIGHTNCGMVNLAARKNIFVDGLVENGGWEKEKAEEHFMQFAPIFEIGHEVDFIISEAERLRKRYPKVMVAPMIYKVEDNRLYLIQEGKSV